MAHAVDFAQSVNAGIVTSMATSPGARGDNGDWHSDNAARLFHYTASLGATIAAAEFANEPNMIGLTQPPDGYSVSTIAATTADSTTGSAISPDTLVLAPGAVEMGQPMRTIAKLFSGRDTFEPMELLAQNHRDRTWFPFITTALPHSVAIFPSSAVNQPMRLMRNGSPALMTASAAPRKCVISVAPGSPLWNTESGETACGGNPWASTYADLPLPRSTGAVCPTGRAGFFHNTLAASDYAILDEHSFAPRPDYWAAWLWRELMGTTV